MKKFIAVYIDLENVAGILDLDVMIQDIILEEIELQRVHRREMEDLKEKASVARLKAKQDKRLVELERE